MDPQEPKLKFDLQRPSEVKGLQHQHQQQGAAGIQFDSVEAMLRADRANTVPPASLGARLDAALIEQPARKPWWRRLLGS